LPSANDTKETLTGLNQCVGERVIHQTEFSSEIEKLLFERIKYVERRGLMLTLI
jgi:hypothetical protein